MKKTIILFFILTIISCQSDVENLKINGVVSNSETDSPMSRTELKVICWYYGNSPDQSYSGEETKKVTTNDKGEFEVEFEKGAFVEILIDETGFSEVHETLYITSKNNTFDIKMESK